MGDVATGRLFESAAMASFGVIVLLAGIALRR
jgi:hypothetical protein